MLRRLAGEDPEVNEEWNCDKGRWAFVVYATLPDRDPDPAGPQRGGGTLREASWTEALERAADGLRARDRARRRRGSCPVVGCPSKTPTPTPSSGASRLAPTMSMPGRAPHSDEELSFLASRVAGTYAGDGSAVTYADLEAAPHVLLAGFEPEEESPIVFLRLRKAARTRGLIVHALAPFATGGNPEDVRSAAAGCARHRAGVPRCAGSAL